MMAELNNYKFMKTEPLKTEPLHFWRMKETVFPNVAVQAKTIVHASNIVNVFLAQEEF